LLPWKKSDDRNFRWRETLPLLGLGFIPNGNLAETDKTRPPYY